MILLALHISGEDRVQPDPRKSPTNLEPRPTILLGLMELEKRIFRASDLGPAEKPRPAPHIPLKA